MEITFEQIPKTLGILLQKIENLESLLTEKKQDFLPPKLNINRAASFASRTPNALRIQVSLGNLKVSKVGNRLYFETEYLKKWINGELPEQQPDYIPEKIDAANFLEQKNKKS